MPPTPSLLWPFINGIVYSFRSIELRMNNSPLPIYGFKSINYNTKLTKGNVYGSRPQKLGRTRGKNEDTSSCEMLRQQFEILKGTLGAGGVGFGEVPFDIVVQYAEVGAPVITDTLFAVTIDEVDLSNSEGDDAAMAKLTLNQMRTYLNGVPIAAPIGII
jgi:hypothetical protein